VSLFETILGIHGSNMPASTDERHGGVLDPAALAALLDAVAALLSRYVVFRSTAQRTAVVLWIAHAHALKAFEVTPYLNVRSAEKRSGKTRLLETLAELVPRPWLTVQPTEAVLFRKIARDDPTLLLDEVDTIFKGPSTDRTEGLRAVLNSGYRRGATVDRCTGRDKEKLAAFPVFCAKVLAGIGTLPDTVNDRCIPIVLARRKRDEGVRRFRVREVREEAGPIRDALCEWASAAIPMLREAPPNMPEGLLDRAEEVWEPLISVADMAGAEWPALARSAALELNGGESATESLGVQLLAGIRGVFDGEGVEKMLTADLLRALVKREAEPWAGSWGRDVDQAREDETPRKPAMDLARHLKPFEVQPKKLRVGERTANGYERADFEDAFARYLPAACSLSVSPEGRNNGTTVGAQGFEAFRPFPTATQVGTPETVGGQGLCRRSDFHPVAEGHAGLIARTTNGPAAPGRPCRVCGGITWHRVGCGWTCSTCYPAPGAS
jgi:hypothetical protein